MISSSPKFTKAETWPDTFIREKKVSPDQVHKIFSAVSVIAATSDDKRKKFHQFLDETIEKHFSLTQDKELSMAYSCPLFWFKKID